MTHLMIIKLSNKFDRIYPTSRVKNNCVEVQMSKLNCGRKYSET